MFGKGKFKSSNVWKKGKLRNLMLGKRQNLELQRLEKGKIENSDVWKKEKLRIPLFEKRQSLEFQCLEKANLRTPMCGKENIYNSNV